DLARFDAVVDGLLTGPMLGVQAGIHNQTPRAEQFEVELTEAPLDVVPIPARFGGQSFGIQPPSLAQRGDSSERPDLAEARQILVFDLQRDLEVMPRHGLVVDDAAQTELRHPLDATGILERSRARTIRRGAV